MIRTVAVQGYRSLRDLLLPLGQLSVITGERKRQIKRVSIAPLARRCRVEFGRRFPCPRRRLALDFLGGSRDYCPQRPTRNTPGATPRQTEGCESQAWFRRRYVRLQHRFGLSTTASTSDYVWPRSPCETQVHLAWTGLPQSVCLSRSQKQLRLARHNAR
jgi:hypothetical protein